MKAQEGVELQLCSFFDPGAKCGVSDQRSAPAALPSRNRLGTHFTGGRVGQTAGLSVCGKPRPHRVSIPGRAVNGMLPNCEVYILFRLLGVTEPNVMQILKVFWLYVNVSVPSVAVT